MGFQHEAFSAGYEKNTMFSGRYAGMGNAAVANVEGAEALYFNPAALAGETGFRAVGDLSPTLAHFEGPIAQPSKIESGNHSVILPFGVFGQYGLTPQWGVGVGVFTSGGTKATYDAIDYSGVNAALTNLRPDVKSELSITEVSLGTGYEVFPGFKLGAAWRIAMVRADLATAVVSPTLGNSLVAVSLNNLTATQYNGFRLGAQWVPKDAGWGLGATFRSNLDFIAEGDASGKIESGVVPNAPVRDLQGGKASVGSSFPKQVAVGGFYNVSPLQTRAVVEYVWTEYSRNRALNLNGGLGIPAGAIGPLTPPIGVTFGLPDIPQNWRNQNNVRVGFEYFGMPGWTGRLGYVYTSQVVPNNYARATFSSPAHADTFTIGAGKASLFARNLDVNAALEYSRSSGRGEANPVTGTFANDYSETGWALHLGASYAL